MFRLIWAAVADVVVISWTLIAAFLAVVAALLTRSARPVHIIERWWARAMIGVCGMRLEVEGLHHLEPGRSYVIISNHESHLDICATIVGLGRKILFVAKQELSNVPIFGRALAVCGHIVIDRNNSEKAINTVNAAVRDSPDGSCILFYAEGTRNPDGKVRAFKKGGVTLALRTGLPIVPLTVSGTRKLLPKGARLIRPGERVRLTVAPPIETAGLPLEARDGLNERVREIIIRNCSEDG